MKWIIPLAIGILTVAVACTPEKTPTAPLPDLTDATEMRAALSKHLKAVSDKDYATLQSTLADSGTMHLILPDGMISRKVSEFLKFHDEWFADTTSNWSLKNTIRYAKRQGDMGMALVEATYNEPDRKGKPYMHRKAVSYVLEKQGDKWIVIKDHASTVKKTE